MTWSQTMRSVLIATALIGIVPSALLAGGDNPFAKAKVGEWVEYRMTGPGMEGKTKMTIVAKGDREVTYEVAATLSTLGQEKVAATQRVAVDPKQAYTAIAAANLKRAGTKIETEGEGAEKLKAGGKEFDTKWTKMKCTTTQNGVTIVSDFKFWFCQDVPVSGLVRMETSTGTFTTKLELIGSGSK